MGMQDFDRDFCSGDGWESILQNDRPEGAGRRFPGASRTKIRRRNKVAFEDCAIDLVST